MRRNITYGQHLEKQIGFSRAVRIGNTIAVTATAPIAADGSTAAPGDMYGQARRCLDIIADVLKEAGAGMGDVIRTRVFLTDMDRWEEAAKAHGELFSKVQPACSFIGASRFINPAWLVEIEADAIVEP